MLYADSRCKVPVPMTYRGGTPWLVKGQPPLDPISEPVKAELGVVDVVLNNLLLVEPASVSMIQGFR